MKLYKEKLSKEISNKLYTENGMQERLKIITEYNHKRLGLPVDDWQKYFTEIEVDFGDYLKAVAEELGWSVKYEQNNEKTVTFQQHSPAGEDLELTFNYDTEEEIPQLLEEYYEFFDVDEHVEELVIARHFPGIKAVPTVSELLEDAQEIEQMLFKLSTACSKALTKCLHDKEED